MKLLTNVWKPAALLSCLALAAATAQAGGITGQIYSDDYDGFTEFRDSGGPWPAVHPSFDGSGGEGFFMNVGEWFGPGLTSAVMPFQIPDLGVRENPFTSVNLGVHMWEKGNATVTGADLYAVRTNATPDLQSTDHYSGAAPDPTPGVELLQEDFLKPSDVPDFAAVPNIFSDATGDANLLTYLNNAYDGGAGVGQFVFLRLSYGKDGFADGWDAYKITSRNAGFEGDWPVITYAAVPEPVSAALLGLGGVLLAARRR